MPAPTMMTFVLKGCVVMIDCEFVVDERGISVGIGKDEER